MASLIPALSEKAKHKLLDSLPRIAKEDLDENTFRCGFMFFEAFQDLFDLEKYPITWEQLFDFCENHPCMSVNDFYAHGTEFIYRKDGDDGYLKIGSIHFNYYPPYTPKRLFEGTVLDTLKRIARVAELDLFIIIGEIHDWWEKPQTY